MPWRLAFLLMEADTVEATWMGVGEDQRISGADLPIIFVAGKCCSLFKGAASIEG